MSKTEMIRVDSEFARLLRSMAKNENKAVTVKTKELKESILLSGILKPIRLPKQRKGFLDF